MVSDTEPNENGDIEQRPYRFNEHWIKRCYCGAAAIRHAGRVPGFSGEKLFEQLNSGRKQKLAEELDVLRAFPNRRYEGAKAFGCG